MVAKTNANDGQVSFVRRLKEADLRIKPGMLIVSRLRPAGGDYAVYLVKIVGDLVVVLDANDAKFVAVVT